MSDAITARLTRAGLAKVWNASQTGLQVTVSHMALGRGKPGTAPGYEPTGAETALFQEFLRVPVGSGTQIDPGTIQIQGLITQPVPATGMAWEMGLFLSDGTLFAVNASTQGPITWVGAQETIILAAAIALDEVPQGAVTWIAGGPNVNILLAEPMADMATALLATQTHILRGALPASRAVLPIY